MIAPNNCPAGPANVYNFIHANQAGANALSQQSGVNADYLLGLSGWESQWGANRFAQQGNNFFSLHGGSSAPFANGSMKAGGANVYLSTFPQSALAATRYPSSFFNALTGIGHSLHVPAPGGADPSTYGTTNGAFTFTTHMDTAYSTWHTPIGAAIHGWVDVRDKGAHRKPCGGAR